MRIAIIGSGIAGLTASHLLQKKGHDVHLFEGQNQLGMSAHSIDFQPPHGGPAVWGDVPSRMFNGALWPAVVELYQSLGLVTTTVDAQQSYRREDEKSALQFQMPFEWSSEIIRSASSSLLALAGSLGTVKGASVQSLQERTTKEGGTGRRSKFLAEINRLRKQGLRDLATLDAEQSFQSYLDEKSFSAEFREAFLFPALSSTVCTCSHEAISNYPAIILLDAMQHITGEQKLCRVEKGSRTVSERLSENVTLNFSTPAGAVKRERDGVTLVADGITLPFDHVVIATQANQAAGLCCDLEESEAAVLNGFQYEDVEVVVHTDQRFMPSVKSQWSVFNFVASAEDQESMCTVWMNQFHTNWKSEGMTEPVFQTIRPIKEVASGKRIRWARLQRPLVDCNSWSRWRQLREFHQQPQRRIWFCGSYAMPGIPLLESAVKSANEISNAISGT